MIHVFGFMSDIQEHWSESKKKWPYKKNDLQPYHNHNYRGIILLWMKKDNFDGQCCVYVKAKLKWTPLWKYELIPEYECVLLM